MNSSAARVIYAQATGTATSAPARRRLRVIEGGRAAHQQPSRVAAKPSTSTNTRSRASRTPSTLAVTLTALAFALSLAGCFVLTDVISQRELAAAFANTSITTVTVLPGDTIWQIAEEHPVAGCTTKDVVRYITETNDLRAECLHAGMVLEVPSQR